jgi:hypothetical protein
MILGAYTKNKSENDEKTRRPSFSGGLPLLTINGN